MSIQGELHITLTPSPVDAICRIRSTRPVQIGRLFSEKSVQHALEKLPLLFSICGKAQTISTVRAVESERLTSASTTIESQREALISLECLREQCLRLFMDWPAFIDEEADRSVLSHIAQGLNHLMQALEPSHLFSYLPQSSETTTNSHAQKDLWQGFSHTLTQSLFASSVDVWLDSIHYSVEKWAEQQQTQTARFIYWLQQKDWKDAGSSSLPEATSIADDELVKRLLNEREAFTSQPDWQGNCHEVSWFSRQQHHAVVAQLTTSFGNGLYTRMLARLIDVADLIQKLDRFFVRNTLLQPILTTVQGLAHTEAARGRLTHYIEVENQTVNQLVILAPTEWNFHPQGVAQQSLQNLLTYYADANETLNETRHETRLKQQADLIIHAIDPCVGYQLQIDTSPDRAITGINGKTSHIQTNKVIH